MQQKGFSGTNLCHHPSPQKIKKERFSFFLMKYISFLVHLIGVININDNSVMIININGNNK